MPSNDLHVELNRLMQAIASDSSNERLALLHLQIARTYLVEIMRDERCPGPATKASGLVEEAVQTMAELVA